MSVNPYRPNLEEADGQRPASLFPLPVSASQIVRFPTPEDELWLTDEMLFNFQRCHRRAFLDIYSNGLKPDAPSDYLLKLRQDSLAHQLRVLAEEPTHRVQYPRHDWMAGAKATLELMQAGVERISHAVLIAQQPDGVTLVSCPDLLVKQPGHSNVGDWLYVPTEIKLGKRPKLDYQITAAFHAYVLSLAQGAWSETCWLMLRQREPYAVDLVELLPKMEAILEKCIQTLRSPHEPEVFISHNRCDLCHWYSHCYGLAQVDEHLSLLPGVTPNRYVHLKELQLVTVEALAAASPHKLEPLPGFGAQVAHKLVQQAQSKLQNRALPRPTDSNGSSPYPLLTPAELPTASVELYFDIEAAPEQNLVYLHGVLVVDRDAQTETFHALLADSSHGERSVWESFLDLVWQYPDAPIYHFCPYEVQTVRRLADCYGAPPHRVDPLMDRFVDLHERVTRVATLPVESYALKPIARWLGFNWRDPDASGAQSIYWYAQWLATGDRSFLEAILRYNEDDCRATHRVKDWLVEFVANHSGNEWGDRH